AVVRSGVSVGRDLATELGRDHHEYVVLPRVPRHRGEEVRQRLVELGVAVDEHLLLVAVAVERAEAERVVLARHAGAHENRNLQQVLRDLLVVLAAVTGDRRIAGGNDAVANRERGADHLRDVAHGAAGDGGHLPRAALEQIAVEPGRHVTELRRVLQYERRGTRADRFGAQGVDADAGQRITGTRA